MKPEGEAGPTQRLIGHGLAGISRTEASDFSKLFSSLFLKLNALKGAKRPDCGATVGDCRGTSFALVKDSRGVWLADWQARQQDPQAPGVGLGVDQGGGSRALPGGAEVCRRVLATAFCSLRQSKLMSIDVN